MIYYLLVVINVFVASLAQMMLKKGANIPHDSVVKDYLNVWVIGGYGLMGLAMLANIFALSKGVQVKELSIIETLSYIFVPLLSFFLFNESITRKKLISIAIIITGIIVFFI